jgi:transcriptional regulator with XRE-family HTH domain
MSGKRADAEDRRIGNLLKIMRHKAGLSQTDLGEAIGVSFQQVQKYERGTNRIGSGKLVRLATALGVEPQQFFSPSGRKRSGSSDELLQLLADKQNLRALTAFASIENARIKAACLDLLEQTAEQG